MVNPVFRVEEYIQENGVIQADIERAKSLLAEYKERKAALAQGAKRKK